MNGSVSLAPTSAEFPLGQGDPIGFARPDREHAALAERLEGAAVRVLRSGRYVLGEEVLAFERELASFVGVPFALGMSSGTDALVAALYALGVGPGDQVIVGAFGFVAAAEAVVRVGAEPVFADVLPRSLGLDPARAAEARGERTRAAISVDLFGVVHPIDPLRKALGPDVRLLQDSAQAFGASSPAEGASAASMAGVDGDIGCFSFFPSKSLGAAGDGGACVTGDRELADRVRRARAHGASGSYIWSAPGGNYRLDELQAALLRVKLEALPARLSRRRSIGDRLAQIAIERGAEVVTHEAPLSGTECSGSASDAAPPSALRGYCPLAIRVPSGARADVLSELRRAGVDARVHYPTTLPESPAFARFAPRGARFPEAERACRELISIPCHPELTDTEVERLGYALEKALPCLAFASV
jgi:dTDP-4-amino-4,6-dideoxygalactose transaminase